jgi:hypothetical protein
MPSFLRDFFGSSSSRRRSERESDPFSSSANYGSGESTNRYDPYQSSSQSCYGYEPTYPARSRSTHSSGSGLGCSASVRSEDMYAYDRVPYNFCGVSPPRGRAERPRRDNPWEYDMGRRSVSPVDELPYVPSWSRSSRLQRSASAREARSTYDDPYASSRAQYGFSSRAAYSPDSYRAVGTDYDYNPYEELPSTSELSRRHAVRRRVDERPTFFYSGGEYDPCLCTQRRPNIDANFRNGGFNRGYF